MTAALPHVMELSDLSSTGGMPEGDDHRRIMAKHGNLWRLLLDLCGRLQRFDGGTDQGWGGAGIVKASEPAPKGVCMGAPTSAFGRNAGILGLALDNPWENLGRGSAAQLDLIGLERLGVMP